MSISMLAGTMVLLLALASPALAGPVRCTTDEWKYSVGSCKRGCR